MKGLSLGCALCLASLISSFGQVTVEVLLEQNQFLPGEAIPAAVRITNRSGQRLSLGTEPDWLTFAVESPDHLVIRKLGEVPVMEPFELDSSSRGTKRVDLAPYFSLTRPGRYVVTATVRVKEWSAQLTSETKSFDIVDGTKLWERDFGVPKSAGASGEFPEMRKYVLQQATYLRSNLKLYVRITDGSGARAIKVFPLGPMLSFGQPEAQVDSTSNLHVLYQNGPRSFSYTVVDPDGEVTLRQTYDYTTRPRLQPDEKGKISIVGGTRHVTSSDLPKNKDEVTPAKP